jgi:hypothetical protein
VSRFSADFGAVSGGLDFHLAEAATYVPASGSSVALRVVVHEQAQVMQTTARGVSRVQEIVLDVIEGTFSGEPAVGASVTLGGRTLSVKARRQLPSGLWQLTTREEVEGIRKGQGLR